MNKIKRYKLIDNKTGKVSEYTSFKWELAWFIVYISCVGIGTLIGYYLL